MFTDIDGVRACAAQHNCGETRAGDPVKYCITPIFRVEEIFAIFANWDFARNFPPAKIISTANGISRNYPPAKFTSREIFLPAKIKF